MHTQRMRSFVARAGWVFVLPLVFGASARAERIRPADRQAFPEIAGAIDGTQSYAFNPATGTGTFEFRNVPYLLTLGPKVADEYDVRPTSEGVRGQALRLTLDQAGRLVEDPSNAFALYGTVVVGGQTYQGLLLQGTPTAFAAQAGRAASFDLNVTITGGALAQTFGQDVALELRTTPESGFDGDFSKGFATTIARSETLGAHAPGMTPGPESTALVVLLACGSWLAFRRPFRRVPRRDLLAPDCA